VNLFTLLMLGIGGLMFYGVTRDVRAQPWGQKLAIGCFITLVVLGLNLPDDGCHTEFDGRSNPVICD
jgi:hypothetical protein